MSFEDLPVELYAYIVGFCSNPNIFLVSLAFRDLEEHRKEVLGKRLMELCIAGDERAEKKEFQEIFSFRHFMVCFRNERFYPASLFVRESIKRSTERKDEDSEEYLMWYNRWLGRNNILLRYGDSYSASFGELGEERSAAYWFGRGEARTKISEFTSLNPFASKNMQLGKWYRMFSDGILPKRSSEMVKAMGSFGMHSFITEIVEEHGENMDFVLKVIAEYLVGCVMAGNNKAFRLLASAISEAFGVNVAKLMKRPVTKDKMLCTFFGTN